MTSKKKPAAKKKPTAKKKPAAKKSAATTPVVVPPVALTPPPQPEQGTVIPGLETLDQVKAELTKTWVTMIEELVDETVGSLEPAELQKLHDKLVVAQTQLDDQIDVLDRAIQDRQINKSPEADLIEEQQPLMELKESVDDMLEQIRGRVEDDEWLIIDGEIIDVLRVRDACDSCPASVEEGRRDWYVDENAEEAGKRARRYWEEMAENDPSEFACMMGKETLVKWGLNQYAGPGSTKVRNLQEWLDLFLDTPEEHWGSYDQSERDVDFCSEALESELGFKPTVAYRHN